MNCAVLTRLSALCALLLALSVAACSDDDSGGSSDTGVDRGGRPDTGGDSGVGDSGSDVPILDQGVSDSTDDSGSNICDQIGAADNLGQVCDPNVATACGSGGACLTFEQGADPVCFQVCVPGQCEGLCSGTERCLTIVDSDGNSIPIFEGGPDAGVCSEPETGDQGAYDECGQTVGACQAGNDCLSLTGIAGAPYCAPICSSANTACPSSGATAGQCVLGPSQDNPTNCALVCDEANAGTGTGCPDGMTCTATGQGAGICMWPEG